MARGLLTNNLATRLELRGFEAPHQKETLNVFLSYLRAYDFPGRAKKEGTFFFHVNGHHARRSVKNEGYAVIRVACSW